jgi:putative DNA primase/helicase
MMRSAEIHAQLAGRWRDVLIAVGIDAQYLHKKAGPCPACGGKDRFTFDDRKQKGDSYCRRCGAGDGFQLIMRVMGCDFATARRLAMQAAGLLACEGSARRSITAPAAPAATGPAEPTPLVRSLLRGTCGIDECEQVMAYLAGRQLLPLPQPHPLRAHQSAPYVEDNRIIGYFPALVAPVVDVAEELVSAHVTYIHAGRKLASHKPRKLLSRLTGRTGCAVRLSPLIDGVLGVGEGIETCLAAAKLHGAPVWSALSAALLVRFEPPPNVRRLIIFSDRDTPGLKAAAHLMEQLHGKLSIEMKVPEWPHKDFADSLIILDHMGERHDTTTGTWRG